MLPKLSILSKVVAAIIMIAALCFLTTANYWVYGMQKQQVVAAADSAADEEQDGNPSVPNPVEEKNANTLQNLSEYLHDGHHTLTHPEAIIAFGNRHDFIKLPIHHPELLTPPPKQLS